MTKLDSTTYAAALAGAGVTEPKLAVTIAKALDTDDPVAAVMRHRETYNDAIVEAAEIAEGRPWVSQRVAAQALVALLTAGVTHHEAVHQVRLAVDADPIKTRLQAHWAWQNDPRQMTVSEQVALLTDH